MQRERGKGYKLSCAYTGGELGEVFGGLVHTGSAHCAPELVELLVLIEKRVGSPPYPLHNYRAHIHHVLTEAEKLDTRGTRRDEQAQRARKSQRRALLTRRAQKLHIRAQLLHQEAARFTGIAGSLDALRSVNPPRALLIRGDAGFGSIDNIGLLSSLGYDFLLKGYSPHTASRFAREVPENQWVRFNPITAVAELGVITLPGCPYPVRTVLGRTKAPTYESPHYFHLVTTVPETVKDARGLVRFYNSRQSIEAFIKTGKNVLNLKHFRVRNFYGIQFVLLLGLLAHNFMTWARRDIFAGTPLARMGIREFVEHAMRVPARVESLEATMPITLFPETNMYAQALIRAIEKRSPAQLRFPFTENRRSSTSVSFF